MAEKDFIGEPLILGFSGSFDMQALYMLMYRWFKKHGYEVDEKEFREYRDEGKRKLSLIWKTSKKADDYVKYVVEVKLKLVDIQNITMKQKKLIRAEMTLTLVPYLLKDYEDTWARKSWMKFFREAYDRLVISNRMDTLEKGLREETKRLIREVRDYLDLTKLDA